MNLDKLKSGHLRESQFCESRVNSKLLKIKDKLGRFAWSVAEPIAIKKLEKTERAYGVIVVRGEVLLVVNTVSDGRWRLPGGGVKKGEPAKHAAMREVQEELDIDLGKLCLESPEHLLSTKHPEHLFGMHMFVFRLEEMPEVKANLLEISKWDMFSFEQTSKLDGVDPVVQEAVLDYANKRQMV